MKYYIKFEGYTGTVLSTTIEAESMNEAIAIFDKEWNDGSVPGFKYKIRDIYSEKAKLKLTPIGFQMVEPKQKL